MYRLVLKRFLQLLAVYLSLFYPTGRHFLLAHGSRGGGWSDVLKSNLVSDVDAILYRLVLKD